MTSQSSSNTQFSRGFLFALISSLILSTTAVLIRYLTVNYHMPALVLTFWRAVFCLATALIVLAVFKPSLLRVKRSDLGLLVLYGVILAIFNATWTISVAMNGAAVSTVLEYSSAAFTALLGRWLLKEELNWTRVLAILFTFAGCIAVTGLLDQSGVSTDLTGILVGVLTGLFYAVYSLMGRFASQRGLNPWTTLPYIFAVAAVFMLCINLAFAGIIPGTPVDAAGILWREGPVKAWGILFLLATGPTMLGFGTYLVSLSYLPSSIANLLMTSEPVFTTIIAFLFLGERMTIFQVSGSLLILASVAFLHIMESKNRKNAGASKIKPLAVEK